MYETGVRNLPNFLLRHSFPSLPQRTRETLVAGSFMVIPKGQPHKVHCLEPGVVFVSYEGNPDITPIAEHDA